MINKRNAFQFVSLTVFTPSSDDMTVTLTVFINTNQQWEDTTENILM